MGHYTRPRKNFRTLVSSLVLSQSLVGTQIVGIDVAALDAALGVVASLRAQSTHNRGSRCGDRGMLHRLLALAEIQRRRMTADQRGLNFNGVGADGHCQLQVAVHPFAQPLVR